MGGRASVSELGYNNLMIDYIAVCFERANAVRIERFKRLDTLFAVDIARLFVYALPRIMGIIIVVDIYFFCGKNAVFFYFGRTIDKTARSRTFWRVFGDKPASFSERRYFSGSVSLFSQQI